MINSRLEIQQSPDTSVSAFLDDLADDLERVSTFACPIIMMRDVNIRLDVADDPHVIKWRSVIDSHGLAAAGRVNAPAHWPRRASHVCFRIDSALLT